MKNLLKSVIITTLFAGLLLAGCDNGGGSTNSATSQGKLLILQAYGSSNDAAGASHPFVELYNTTDTAINLSNHFLWYADGTSVTSTVIDGGGRNTNTRDNSWEKIALSGSIPGKGSFLVVGPKQSNAARYQIPDNYGDINDENFTLSNRAFKVALLQGSTQLTDEIQNPFDNNNGKPVSGYIDMVGSANSYSTNGSERDRIFGFETTPTRNSASEAVRRADLIDTDNNSADFVAARYAASGAGAFTKEMLEVRRPRNSSAGAWDPFADPAPPVVSKNTLLIFQVYGTGKTENDSASTHSFIELYNNSDTSVDLSTFSLHYADGKENNGNASVQSWTKINLTGIIPAKGSYLILGKQMVTYGETQTETTNGRLDFTGTFVTGTNTTPDQLVSNFVLSNRAFKVALMSNQNNITVANPWGDPACVDLTSARNTSNNDYIDAAKGEDDLAAINANSSSTYGISKQKSWRRTSLTVIDVTLTDFTPKQYSSLSEADIVKFRPRTSADGSYTPQF